MLKASGRGEGQGNQSSQKLLMINNEKKKNQSLVLFIFLNYRMWI